MFSTQSTAAHLALEVLWVGFIRAYLLVVSRG